MNRQQECGLPEVLNSNSQSITDLSGHEFSSRANFGSSLIEAHRQLSAVQDLAPLTHKRLSKKPFKYTYAVRAIYAAIHQSCPNYAYILF